MLRLELRKEPSRAMRYATPVLAVLLTILAGGIMFALMGKDPVEALHVFFISPLSDLFSITELMVKASPLILIAVGLSFGFRAGVWNIGAEGQFTVGALTGGVVALIFYNVPGIWLLPMMTIAGVLGGMAWAAIPAFLRTRYNANEILVSLMLTYVAILLLSVLVHGPLRDPEGLNFPESRMFHDSATLPILIAGTRANIGFVVAILVAITAWIVMARHVIGFQVRVMGEAPLAARFSGFLESRIVWLCLMISGGLAGMAGLFEAAGSVGQLVPMLPVGYGFTAIIVAFLGRLNPIGIVAAGLVMAVTYIGGEAAQIELGLPSAVTGVFQGMLLFFLLGIDVLVHYQIKSRRPSAVAAKS
ncbi:ABC transporter permease [Oceanibacterium hippocampi]|uniref:Branched-chain amino acid transport system / permease component n=1 Tax=Oceanibacterium hippocampi TaxID=745714 RepID=A0A1Y5U339_9PROT|nr:ABC transporter permease [Oceanibacterium hippocampi]SLN76004.1 Branched-chain amino acid transport system / permease component [Oceanibacterium hippocampi]